MSTKPCTPEPLLRRSKKQPVSWHMLSFQQDGVCHHAASKHLCFANAPDSNYLSSRHASKLFQDNTKAMLTMLHQLGGDVKARPTFAERFRKADDKQALVGSIKPYVYMSTEAGIRSSFCKSKAGSSSMRSSCQQLKLLLSM